MSGSEEVRKLNRMDAEERKATRVLAYEIVEKAKEQNLELTKKTAEEIASRNLLEVDYYPEEDSFGFGAYKLVVKGGKVVDIETDDGEESEDEAPNAPKKEPSLISSVYLGL
jgi:hypothetical protein